MADNSRLCANHRRPASMSLSGARQEATGARIEFTSEGAQSTVAEVAAVTALDSLLAPQEFRELPHKA